MDEGVRTERIVTIYYMWKGAQVWSYIQGEADCIERLAICRVGAVTNTIT